MKKLFFAALGLACILAPQLQAQAVGVHKSIIATWVPPVGSPCSSSVTVACFTGYTETLTPPAGVTGGAFAVPVGLVSTYTWTPGSFLFCGTWNVSLVVNWLDPNGVPVASAPATGAVLEPCPFVPSPATGLSTKVQ